ncbi:uncharacterized protein LOC124282563 [Haliotis rubra]|uniref:uncharacterized protein LOC124282563 n=1 Tax=Haliotis rubra TaxID=36100 RepID=UPI001EE57630|nr:uncharacterized protein LOC124282563 [Haliotis rubra]
MRERGCSKVEVCLTTANIIGVIAIVMIAAVIGTDRWVMWTVDRTKLTSTQRADTSSARFYHTRHRGMFRECYPGNDTSFLDTSNDVIDKNCFQLKFVDNIDGSSAEYQLMIGLYTSFMALFVVAEVVFVVAYILGLCLCVRRLHSQACYASIFCFIAAFILALGMALFHASIYVQREQVRDVLTDRQKYYQMWPNELKLATVREFKESYIVAWVGLILAAITAICYGLAAKFLADNKHRRRPYSEKAFREPYFYDNPQYALDPYQPKVIPVEYPTYATRPQYYDAPRPIIYSADGYREDISGYRIREMP